MLVTIFPDSKSHQHNDSATKIWKLSPSYCYQFDDIFGSSRIKVTKSVINIRWSALQNVAYTRSECKSSNYFIKRKKSQPVVSTYMILNTFSFQYFIKNELDPRS